MWQSGNYFEVRSPKCEVRSKLAGRSEEAGGNSQQILPLTLNVQRLTGSSVVSAGTLKSEYDIP